MSDDLCVICGDRPAHGAYGCTECLARTRRLLGEVGDMAQAARDVAQRQAVRGTGGGTVGKPGSQLPLGLETTSRLDAVQNALTTLARDIAETRGVEIPRPPAVRPASGPTCARPWSCNHGSCRALREPLRASDEIEWVARWLVDQVEWSRHRPAVDEFVRDVEASHRIIRSLASGPRERIYLGTCGAPFVPIAPEVAEEHGINPAVARLGLAPCVEPLYGRLGAGKATCRTCGAEHNPDQRIAERTALAHSYRYTAAEIEQAYPGVVHRTNIGRWRKAGLLTVHGEHEGNPLYALDEVLALVAMKEQEQARQHV
ncbi:hypothetical protein FHR83_007027 [Actinoplanes campanulatus]|uniref:Uncharacterized protein n=1 Tax=Actinoplanes campanulatus TaxID=113559 RepID=A0A7W5ANF1_9ACTN|nr:hypothetical protein [Actinoplanes campanulatus]MBB3099321.1 hypothetical protein [Actinoplanes campanulatus]